MVEVIWMMAKNGTKMESEHIVLGYLSLKEIEINAM